MSGIKIGSNINSLFAQRRLSDVTASLDQTQTRLASGLRINTASDDASGLSIASSLNASKRVYTVGIRNLNDGISALSIAEGALGQLQEVVVRQMELAEQSANGVYSLTQRKALHDEAEALVSEYNRVVETATFNGVKLFDGSYENLRLQAGFGLDESLRLSIGQYIQNTVGTGTFAASNTVALTGLLRSVELADLNGDGILDLINGVNDGPLMINFGNGDGTFSVGMSYSFSRPQSLMVGDLNNDGFVDIVANGSGGGNGNLLVLMSNGDGTFQAPISYSAFVTGGTSGSTMGDVNGDGIVDLVVGNNPNGKLAVLIGNGNGTFKAAVSYNGGPVGAGLNSFVSLHDVNGDGKLDLVSKITGTADQATSILIGNGDGTFRLMVTIDTESRGAGLAVADFDRDGILDFAATTSGGYRMYTGNGDGTFRVETRSVNGGLSSIKVTDYDEDGFVDLIGINGGSLGFTVLHGNGDGTFSEASSTTSGLLNGLAFGDVNGDGAVDIVGAGGGAYTQVFTASTSNNSKQAHLYLLTQQGARDSLEILRSSLNVISAELGAIGATQSRIDVAKNNLASTITGYDAAHSRIMDADIASESANLVRQKLLQQVATSVLAQANQQPSLVLSLLSS